MSGTAYILSFFFRRLLRLSSAAHVHEPWWQESDHTCTWVCCLDFTSTSSAAVSFFTQRRWNSSCAASLLLNRVLLLCGIDFFILRRGRHFVYIYFLIVYFLYWTLWRTVKIGSHDHFLHCATSVSVELSVSHAAQTCPALLRLY